MHDTRKCGPLFSPLASGLRLPVGPLGARLRRVLPGAAYSSLGRLLIAAGEPFEFSSEMFIGLIAVLTTVIAAVSGLFSGLWICPLAAAVCVPAVMVFTLRRRMQARQRIISRRLPYAIDLLTLCVEAGLDLSGAMARLLARESPGPLHDEFSHTLRDIRMGLTRRDAFRNLRQRLYSPAAAAVITALIHADELGTGVSGVLRIQADELRHRRFQHAEKLAMEAPIRMLIPLVGFIFPAVFIILLGPIFLALTRSGIGGS